MSQHDLIIADQGFPAARTDWNNALQALGSNSSGATAPTTTYAFMFWADTANDLLKQRNAANTAWIDVFVLSTGVPVAGAGASDAEKSNIKLNSLRIAALEDDGLNSMDDGIAEIFSNENDVDTALSTNELFDSPGNYYSPVKVGDIEQLTGTTEFFIGDQSNVEKRQAQSFTASGSITVSQVDLKFGTRQETPSGDVTVRIETDNSGAPSGTLAHANATKAVTPVDGQVNSFVFPGTFLLSASTKYWIVTTLPDQTVHEKYKVLGSTSSAYSGGGQAESTDSGATWGAESSVNDLYFKVHATGGAPQDMTLVSDPFTADSAPANVECMLIHEAIDSLTINTDLTLEISRDNGVTWSVVTLTDVGNYNSSGTEKVLRGSVVVSGQPSGTAVKYRIKTLNNKDQRVHAIALGWSA